jgi:lysophospholipase L1-like esterase
MTLVFPPCVRAAQQCLVVGDSLTKEYEVEFPILFPSNPQSWASRNWIEILHQHRNAWFDLGNFSSYADPRITGHEHNWGFPGAQTQEIRDRLSSTALIDQLWQAEFEGQVQSAVERAVVFAGGNDVDSYYGTIYNGGNATTQLNTTRDNLKWIVDYIRGLKPSLPIVLVAVPHVGCTPQVQSEFPTDAVKTARVSTALEAVNANLAAFAQQRGIGFAAGAYDLTKAMINDPFKTGGLEFYRQADADARVRYVFSGDGFHPNTCAHARIAQIVIDAFRAKYPSPSITRLTDRQLLEDVLVLDADLPLTEWLASQSVPANAQGYADDHDGDGVKNLVEFSLDGFSAAQADVFRLPQPVRAGANVTLTFRPRQQAAGYCNIVVQESGDLSNWTDTPAAAITNHGDGAFTVTVAAGGGKFLRLDIRIGG